MRVLLHIIYVNYIEKPDQGARILVGERKIMERHLSLFPPRDTYKLLLYSPRYNLDSIFLKTARCSLREVSCLSQSPKHRPIVSLSGSDHCCVPIPPKTSLSPIPACASSCSPSPCSSSSYS